VGRASDWKATHNTNKDLSPSFCQTLTSWHSSIQGTVWDWKARHNTDAGSSSWCGKGFFSQSQLLVWSLPVSVQPPCATACINIRGHINNPKCWQLYHRLDTGKYYTHWLEWVALLLQLRCLTQEWWPKFSARDKEVYQKQKRKFLFPEFENVRWCATGSKRCSVSPTAEQGRMWLVYHLSQVSQVYTYWRSMQCPAWAQHRNVQQHKRPK